MSLLTFVFEHYGFWILFLGIVFLLGKVILRKFRFSSFSEELFTCASLGFGVCSLLFFSLGVAGLLTTKIILALFGFILVFFLLAWYKRWVLPITLEGLKYDLIIIMGILITINLFFLLVLYPPFSWDAISFHLATAKIYSQESALVFTPYVRFPVFNQLTDLLFTGALTLYDDISAQGISWLSNLVILFGFLAFSYSFYSKSRYIGIYSIIFWLSAPLVLYLSSVAYIDINLTLFTFAAIYSGLIWALRKEDKWLTLSAVFWGFAIGSKYSGLIMCLIYNVSLLIYTGKFRKVQEAIKYTALVTITVLLISSPWFLRNYYYSLNPVFPFMADVFGTGQIWNEQDYKAQMEDLVKQHGLEKNIVNLLDIPHRLSFEPQEFHLEAPFSPLFFLGVLLLLAMPKKSGLTRTLTSIWVIYLVIWFFTAQIPRYLLIVWPVACITFGRSAFYWIEVLAERFKEYSSCFFAIVTVILILVSSNFPNTYLKQAYSERGPIPIEMSERDAFLSQRLSTYQAYKVLNKMPKGRLYALFDENMNFFYRGTFIGDWFGPGRYSSILNSLTSGQDLYNVLKSLDVDYFLVNVQRGNVKVPSDPDFTKLFKLEYSDANVIVYSVVK